VRLTYVITDRCTKDGACVEVCPVDCIHPRKEEAEFEGETKLHVDPQVCIDCGACVPVCPPAAIFAQDELAPGDEHWTRVDEAWYAARR
jgi:NAD-dependent dihydropyrimidine dehydrogenase PreA subunit